MAAMRFAIAGSLVLVACRSRSAPETPAADATPTLASAVASAPAPLDDGAVGRRIQAFFSRYAGGSDFEFMRSACAPKLERFVTLENADIDTVIKSARAFYADKKHVAYSADLRSMRVVAHPRGKLARVPLAIAWCHAPPKAWGNFSNLGGWPPMIGRAVTVDIEVVLDFAGLIVSYVEGGVHAPSLRVTMDARCGAAYPTPAGLRDGAAAGRVFLAGGASVEDLGEHFPYAMSTKGPNAARKIRFGGKELWTDDEHVAAFAEPGGGFTLSQIACLDAPAGATRPDAPDCWAEDDAGP